jgi:hypothetical protein
MRFRTAARWLVLTASTVAAATAAPGAGSLPPGRQHLLTIEGDNTVAFVPQAGLDPVKIDYQARVEYLVNTRTGEEAAAARKKTARKTAGTSAKAKRKGNDDHAPTIAAVVDVSLHSTESRFRQNGRPVVESRASRSRFQGRLQPDAPVLSVSSNEAPPLLQELLKSFDTSAATMLVDDSSKVVERKVRFEGPLRALSETLLSIHTPIPRDVAFWEAPTQLAMGHGQTARGTLRFEKDKQSVAATGGLVTVKVSGVLKAEGAVVGKLIKDGTYTVTGEQAYDPRSREWRSARWSVAVDNELASPGGLTVARAKGTMLVQSKALGDVPPSASEPLETKP